MRLALGTFSVLGKRENPSFVIGLSFTRRNNSIPRLQIYSFPLSDNAHGRKHVYKCLPLIQVEPLHADFTAAHGPLCSDKIHRLFSVPGGGSKAHNLTHHLAIII